MKRFVTIAVLMAFVALLRADIVLAEKGNARAAVVIDPAATAPEQNAARELVDTLRQITGAEFVIQTATNRVPARAILIGPGAAAKSIFKDVPFHELGAEEIVIKTKGDRLLLAGGRPRGTPYAVSRFLEQQCGVRWWTPWASRIPEQTKLRINKLDLREKPKFEYRESYWYPAFNAQWSVRNFNNGQSSRLTPELGGNIRYKGFVHTFYPLVPPEKHFSEHPEWFSLIKGKRTTNRAQLCLTNPQLRDHMVERVKEWLRQSPDAGIISVSQNDWYGWCECEQCKAMDDAEGTHAGTMLDFVNYVAEKIEPEFPQVAVDTLAYQYTRKPPKTLRPRPNVIIRLCSIECDFREVFDAPSNTLNAAFAEDIHGWSRICRRLYVWDYTTDFAHYVQPHPNWFVLGPDLRFFQQHNVRGVFSEGAYQSHGSEMSELRSWVTAQLMWNPNQDDRALINEFIDGYYGTNAAPFIRDYMDLMHRESKGHKLTCYSAPDAKFLKFKPLSEAERLWQKAERAVANDSGLLPRVRIARLPVRYVWLTRWTQLRKECADSGAEWPLATSRKQVADEWAQVANGIPGKPWTKVTRLSESGLTPEKFLARFAQDPP
jgi:hypothetical protein